MSPDPNSLELYDYQLPVECVAQEPAPQRERSRLLVIDRSTSSTADHLGWFGDIVRFLRRGDLLVVNDARVFPARLRFRRPGGGHGEVLLLEPVGGFPRAPRAGEEESAWEALVRPSKWARRLNDGARGVSVTGSPATEVEIGRDLGDGRFEVRVVQQGKALGPAPVVELCDQFGDVPLPPYIKRAPGDGRRMVDRDRYQTVYARSPCAVAAPTAGLHFTEQILDELDAIGIETVRLTHQIGLGTFRPLRGNDLSVETLHLERTLVDATAGERIRLARKERRRIVAVGTTTVRALESFALAGMPQPYEQRTDLFIRPGHRFQLVGAMVTNFHLPRSSLLVLVSAFAGRRRILDAYQRAIDEGFRFYSYGDAMLIL